MIFVTVYHNILNGVYGTGGWIPGGETQFVKDLREWVATSVPEETRALFIAKAYASVGDPANGGVFKDRLERIAGLVEHKVRSYSKQQKGVAGTCFEEDHDTGGLKIKDNGVEIVLSAEDLRRLAMHTGRLASNDAEPRFPSTIRDNIASNRYPVELGLDIPLKDLVDVYGLSADVAENLWRVAVRKCRLNNVVLVGILDAFEEEARAYLQRRTL